MVAQIDIAKRGHIAAAIRAAIEARQWAPGDLHEKLGLKRNGTTAYGWLAARSTPGPNIRKKVAKLLDIPEKDLLPRDIDAPPTQERSLMTMPGMAPRPHKAAAGDVMAFNVMNDGTARVRLDVTLPLEKAMPLFRMLMDAGYIMGQQQPQEVDA